MSRTLASSRWRCRVRWPLAAAASPQPREAVRARRPPAARRDRARAPASPRRAPVSARARRAARRKHRGRLDGDRERRRGTTAAGARAARGGDGRSRRRRRSARREPNRWPDGERRSVRRRRRSRERLRIVPARGRHLRRLREVRRRCDQPRPRLGHLHLFGHGPRRHDEAARRGEATRHDATGLRRYADIMRETRNVELIPRKHYGRLMLWLTTIPRGSTGASIPPADRWSVSDEMAKFGEWDVRKADVGLCAARARWRTACTSFAPAGGERRSRSRADCAAPTQTITAGGCAGSGSSTERGLGVAVPLARWPGDDRGRRGGIRQAVPGPGFNGKPMMANYRWESPRVFDKVIIGYEQYQDMPAQEAWIDDIDRAQSRRLSDAVASDSHLPGERTTGLTRSSQLNQFEWNRARIARPAKLGVIVAHWGGWTGMIGQVRNESRLPASVRPVRRRRCTCPFNAIGFHIVAACARRPDPRRAAADGGTTSTLAGTSTSREHRVRSQRSGAAWPIALRHVQGGMQRNVQRHLGHHA